MSLCPQILNQMRGVFSKYPEVAAVYLFGSRAAGRVRPDSDYDLGVVSVPGSDARVRRLDVLSDLAREGFDRVDLVFLDFDRLMLLFEAVRYNQVIYSVPSFDVGAFFSRVIREYSDFVPHMKIQRTALKKRLTHGSS